MLTCWRWGYESDKSTYLDHLGALMLHMEGLCTLHRSAEHRLILLHELLEGHLDSSHSKVGSVNETCHLDKSRRLYAPSGMNVIVPSSPRDVYRID